MKIKVAALTDRGLIRDNNEDACMVCPDLNIQEWTLSGCNSYIPLNQYGAMFVVADGMGGTNAGDVASSIAIQSITDSFSLENLPPIIENKTYEEYIRQSICKVDKDINKRMAEDPQTTGMGTTIVVCWIVNETAYVGWCGDSRCYVYNPQFGLKQLTKDHSLVQELVDKGEISKKEAFSHPDNNIITRGLGDFDSQPMPDIINYSLNTNDTLLLCSDGLCGYRTNEEIESVMYSNYIDVFKCRDKLLHHALYSGGFDNISIILASIIGDNQNKPISLSFVQKLKRFLNRMLT